MSAITEVKPQTTTWTIDPLHSDVQFSVRHLGLMTVRGHFEKVQGSAKLSGGSLESFEAVIEVSSISTRVADRDKHLRSADFFNVEQWPEMSFRSTRVVRAGGNAYSVTGDLTLAGQTHAVELEVELTDPITDPWGLTRRAATAHGTISRKQWGLVYNQVLEAGGFAIGDEVKITIEVEATGI
jgi:polyisoprenoid-binding protein YceI